MTDLSTLLNELAAPVRSLPAPPFSVLERAADRRRRRRVAMTGTAGFLLVASGAALYLALPTGGDSSQPGVVSQPFVSERATSATVCRAGSPTTCEDLTKPRLAAFLAAANDSPAIPVERTWPCQNPGPYRNADITVRSASLATEVFNVNTGCGFIRNNRTLTYRQVTPQLVAAVFGVGVRVHFVAAYERGVDPDAPARHEAFRHCLSLPGARATGQEPNDRLTRGVTVTGTQAQQQRVFSCLDALANVQVLETGLVTGRG
ncbi:MAG: hypothetical protein JWP11_859 [Frankiales bacterium]|nr:hypothetical protein [Frankiales bacterium]